MMGVFVDHTGKTFGLLTIVKRAENNRFKNAQWICKCECGNLTKAVARVLVSGETRSCGCLIAKSTKERATTHGMSKSREYAIWQGMITRCTNSNRPEYKNYGGRGIGVCDEWKSSFENFYNDMGCRPSKKHTVDRIDNDGDYAPENCRWATRTQQARNGRCNRILTFNGLTMCVAEWAEYLGINRGTLNSRLNHYGWSVERTLTEEVRGG